MTSTCTQAFNFASSAGTPELGTGNRLPISGFAAGSSGSASISTASSFSCSSSSFFSFGGSSSTINPASSSCASLNISGSSWQTQISPVFGIVFTSFGASSSSSPVNSAPLIFNSSAGASPFTALSASVASSSTLPASQPIFVGKPLASGFSAPGNNDQMNSEDSTVKGTVQSSAPPFPLFSQSSASKAAPGFGLGLSVPSKASPFVYSGPQNQGSPLCLSPFQSSGSLEFNAGGSFFMGSGGVENRRVVRVSKSKNRRK